MTTRNLIRIILASIIAWAIILISISYAFAATWTKQAGEFNWYKVNNTNKYLPINPVEVAVPSNWIKQPGVYIQCKSSGGANRYYPTGYNCEGKQTVPDVIVPSCGAFLCQSDFGLVFDLSKNTVLQCPRVFITKEQLALIYEGAKYDNVPACK